MILTNITNKKLINLQDIKIKEEMSHKNNIMIKIVIKHTIVNTITKDIAIKDTIIRDTIIRGIITKDITVSNIMTNDIINSRITLKHQKITSKRHQFIQLIQNLCHKEQNIKK